MSPRAILVTGATGKQGSAVIDALIKANTDFEIVALTRNTQSPSAQNLVQKSPKIKLITGNLDAIDNVFKKAKEAIGAPIWGVFSVQVAMGGGATPQSEERQGKALIDAALSNNVSHFVYTSADRGGSPKSDSNPTYVPHFISKHNIEQHLFNKAKGSDMTWTVLRPVAFLDNLVPDFFGKIFATSYRLSLRKDQTLQVIATSDIGWFAADAFAHSQTEQYRNQSLSLAGDELTFGEFKDVFEKRTGQTLPTTFTIIARIVLWMAKELGIMFKWFGEAGFGADIKSLRKTHPGLKDFDMWLKTESAWKSG